MLQKIKMSSPIQIIFCFDKYILMWSVENNIPTKDMLKFCHVLAIFGEITEIDSVPSEKWLFIGWKNS